MLGEDGIEPAERRCVVKEFIFWDKELFVESGTMGKFAIDYKSIMLLLRGMSMKSVIETEIVKKTQIQHGKPGSDPMPSLYT